MASTFPRFLELPISVQANIWHQAALPHGLLHLDDTLLINIARVSDLLPAFFYFTSPSRILDCAVYTRYHQGEDTIKARGALVGTCNLSRKVAWTIWKEAVEGIEVDEEKADIYEGLGLYAQELVDAKKGLVEVIEEMITWTSHGLSDEWQC